MTTTETTPSTSAATDHVGAVSEDDANRVFSLSILISAVRCTLAYIVFPWILPVFGVTGGVGPGVGLAIGVIAIGFNVASIRRFHRADHRWKWQITVLSSIVITLLVVLAISDIADLLG